MAEFPANMKTIVISPEHEAKLAVWLKTRGGIAVWSNKDLGSSALGSQTFAPADVTTAPHWSCGNSPDFIVVDAAKISVQTDKEVARVKVRRGPPYLGGINRADRAKLDKALAVAGEGAWWRSDYSEMQYGSAWFVAVVCVPDTVRPMAT